eukprot:GEZU01010319.1.p1 GENE.GEZU01010319.1~~GEZU01010319.1.p1  ORF type:complete len:100 (+),score=17.72 GEZU01010319.1:301-600(+)
MFEHDLCFIHELQQQSKQVRMSHDQEQQQQQHNRGNLDAEDNIVGIFAAVAAAGWLAKSPYTLRERKASTRPQQQQRGIHQVGDVLECLCGELQAGEAQ